MSNLTNEVRSDTVKIAISRRSKLRVLALPPDDSPGFKIVLTCRSGSVAEVALFCLLDCGGLCSDEGSWIFRPYEFSMQRYHGRPNVRAATEYVRRRLRTLAA